MTKPVLIGFTGAHRSGKTTYVNKCRGRLPDWSSVHLPSPGAEVNKKFGVKDFKIFEHDLRLALTFQSNMLSTYIKYRTDIFNKIAETPFEERPIVVFADRTPLDFIGYLFTYIMRSQDPSSDEPDFISKMATFVSACRNEYALYDLVIHCPSDIPYVEEEGKPKADRKFQYGVEAGIGYYMGRWNVGRPSLALHDIAGSPARDKAVFDAVDSRVSEHERCDKTFLDVLRRWEEEENVQFGLGGYQLNV